MQLTGIHHLTAVSADAPGNRAFYTGVLGMRLVKKTVNQDDVSAYHLFYADGLASPGTDLTFFDWPVGREQRGHAFDRADRAAGLTARRRWNGGRRGSTRRASPTAASGSATAGSPSTSRIPRASASPSSTMAAPALPTRGSAARYRPSTRYAGSARSRMSVPDIAAERRRADQPSSTCAGSATTSADGVTVHVYAMGDGGPAAELHVAVEPGLRQARQGAGAVHHVAFRTPDDAYDAWADRLRELRVPNSGKVDRFYFRSLYFREPNGILFEIASDGPGFATDEPLDKLGESLSLPPFLEAAPQGDRGRPQTALTGRSRDRGSRAHSPPRPR